MKKLSGSLLLACAIGLLLERLGLSIGRALRGIGFRLSRILSHFRLVFETFGAIFERLLSRLLLLGIAGGKHESGSSGEDR